MKMSRRIVAVVVAVLLSGDSAMADDGGLDIFIRIDHPLLPWGIAVAFAWYSATLVLLALTRDRQVVGRPGRRALIALPCVLAVVFFLVQKVTQGSVLVPSMVVAAVVTVYAAIQLLQVLFRGGMSAVRSPFVLTHGVTLAGFIALWAAEDRYVSSRDVGRLVRMHPVWAHNTQQRIERLVGEAVAKTGSEYKAVRQDLELEYREAAKRPFFHTVARSATNWQSRLVVEIVKERVLRPRDVNRLAKWPPPL
jgi:hypothetical protein